MLLLANGEFSNFCLAEDLESLFVVVEEVLVVVAEELNEAGDALEDVDEESSKVKYSKCNHSICSFVSEAKLDVFVFDKGLDWFICRFFDDM